MKLVFAEAITSNSLRQKLEYVLASLSKNLASPLVSRSAITQVRLSTELGGRCGPECVAKPRPFRRNGRQEQESIWRDHDDRF
jgi:hypothetical protein